MKAPTQIQEICAPAPGPESGAKGRGSPQMVPIPLKIVPIAALLIPPGDKVPIKQIHNTDEQVYIVGSLLP